MHRLFLEFTPFSIFLRHHLQGSFPVLGSFAVQIGGSFAVQIGGLFAGSYISL